MNREVSLFSLRTVDSLSGGDLNAAASEFKLSLYENIWRMFGLRENRHGRRPRRPGPSSCFTLKKRKKSAELLMFVMLFCLLQLRPRWRTSRSVLTVCSSTRTERPPSVITVERCCGGSYARDSNVKVRMQTTGSYQQVSFICLHTVLTSCRVH